MTFKFLATSAALALAAAPAPAQLLGNAGGQLGGTVGGVGQSIGTTLDGTLRGSAAAGAERSIDTRSGRASGRARASGSAAGSADHAASSRAGSGRASARGGASADADGGFGVDAVGTDHVRGTVGRVVGTAGSIALPSVGGGLSGSGSGNASGSFGPLAAAGSVASSFAGALSIEQGMIVRDTAGRTIGEVQQLRTRANGLVEAVLVEVGNRVAALPADNFSVSGDALVSAMSRAEVRREARGR